jgi:hypothetical protein
MPERSSDDRRPWRERVLPYRLLVPVALVLGLAPLRPEPHLVEKLRMLFSGTLSRPIDIFDLVLHGTPAVLLVARVAADVVVRARRTV